jgi:diguanylate cyclase (GGDEF)-like protein
MATPQPAADGNNEIQEGFWLRHIRIGFAVFLAETFFVLIYLGVTPEGTNRLLLRVIVSAWLFFALVGLLAAPKMASIRHRVLLSACWTISSCVAVGIVASLDGGIDSPILFLLFLPIAYAALAFSPFVTAACGLSALVTATVVFLTDSSIHLSAQGALVLGSVLAGASVLSVAASVNRTHRESREQQLTEQIVMLAATDGLTGCAVRRVFYRRLNEEISRSLRNHQPLSLLFIDVDNFKTVNDTYGHLVGDHVLAAIGQVLSTNTRSFEMVGRLGGDEFAVLMPNTEPSHALVAAERFRLESMKAVEVHVTLSVGISGLDLASPTAERMLDDADFALYQVKHAGRDGVTVRHPESAAAIDGPVIDARF